MPVNMPEKKDSMGQAMQVFQAAKSIYDMKNGNVAGGVAGAAGAAGSTGGASSPTVSTAMDRRLKKTQGTP